MPSFVRFACFTFCVLTFAACAKKGSESEFSEAPDEITSRNGFVVLQNGIRLPEEKKKGLFVGAYTMEKNADRIFFGWNNVYERRCEVKGTRVTINHQNHWGTGEFHPPYKGASVTVTCEQSTLTITLPDLKLNNVASARAAQVPPGTPAGSTLHTIFYDEHIYKIGVSPIDGRGYFNSIHEFKTPADWRGWSALPNQTGYTSRPVKIEQNQNKIRITAYSEPDRQYFSIDCKANDGLLSCGKWY